MKYILNLGVLCRINLALAFMVISATNIFGAAPIISGFSPGSGPVGTSVTITGSGFDAFTANNVVFFGATAAQVTSATATSLTVIVPAGATYQPISVLNATTKLIGLSKSPFIVTYTGKNSIVAADFAARVNFKTGAGTYFMKLGDLDGDGKADMVVTNSILNTITVFRNTSTTGTITSSSFAAGVDFAAGGYPDALVIGDMDGDGRPDIVVTNQDDNTISIFRNTGITGTINSSSFAPKVDFTVGSGPCSVAIGDIDGDGKLDIAIANSYVNTATILGNKSVSGSITASSFVVLGSIPTNNTPYNIAIGDLDGDGRPDIVIVNLESNNISVYPNGTLNGGPGLVTKYDFATPNQPESVIIGDLDGDGKPELITANLNGNSISIFHNNNVSTGIDLGTFGSRVDLQVGNSPVTLAMGDLDGDGKPDLVVSNSYSSSMSIFRNITTGVSINASSFAPRVDIATDPYPGEMSLGDIDGDGKADIIVPSFGDTLVSVYQNIPVLTPTAQATNVTFTNTTAGYSTIGWTNGNATSRAVFMSTGATGTPAPVDNTIYTADPNFMYGSQIGSSGWFCVYSGSGNSFDVSQLSGSTSYRVMVVEYNGAQSNPLFLTTTATGNPASFTTPAATAVVSALGPLSALNSTYGTASVTGTFMVGGINLTAGVLVTPPPGYEVSASSTTGFAATVTIGSGGNVAATPVYIRLAATTAAGSYAGDIIISSAGASDVPLATVSSTVSPAALTITATGMPKVYGTGLITTTGSTGFIASATIAGENVTGVTLTPDAAGQLATTSVGAPYAITPSAATGTGGFINSNYNIAYVPFTGTVSKAILTISATATDKVYDNTTTATVTFTDNRISGDVFTINYTSASFADKNAGISKPVTVSGITINGAGAVNYSYNTTTITTATITTVPVIVTAQAATKVYDKTIVSAIVPLVTGLIAPDAVFTAPVQNFNNSNTGMGKALIPSGLSISDGNGGNNYAINYVNATGTITPATVTVTAQPDTRIYNSVNTSAQQPIFTGLITTDVALTAPEQTFDTPNVGSGKTLTAAGLVINDGNGGNNYTVNYLPNTNGVITVATLTYTASAALRNYGVANPAFNGTVSGFAGSDNQASVTSGTLAFTTTATATSSPGNYAITGSGLSASNYVFTQASQNSTALTILPLTDASLSNLSLSTGSLSPTFTAGTTSYTSAVVNSVTSVTLTPVTTDATATVKVNGIAVPGGSASGSIALLAGNNTITTIVTAQDGVTTRTYTVIINRAPSANAGLASLTLSDGILSPSFSTGTNNYTTAINNSISALTLTPTPVDPTATVTINGITVSNASPGNAIALTTGNNTLTIVVIAQDGITKQAYTLVAERAPVPISTAITNILTPNADGINDNWIVKDIDLYPNNVVTVIDRTGRVVYTKTGYANDWGGTFKGLPLAEDTYYYLVDLGPGQPKLKGFITVVRNRR